MEHLLFKGTEERSAASIAEAVDEVGGDFNAYTTKEYTSFYIRLLAEHVDLGLEILSDIMWRPALRPDDLDAERQVILDEILMHADEPADEASEQCSAALFPDHPLGREVLGSQESVTAMTAPEIREFFDHHYRPGNMVVAVAGDLSHDRIAARRGFAGSSGIAGGTGGTGGDEGGVVGGGGAGGAGGRRRRGGAPVRDAPGGAVEPLRVTRRPTEQAHLVLGIRSVDRFDDRRYALAVLNHVLGGGLSSRLFQEIRERRGLAYSVWSERVAYSDAGALTIGAGRAPSTSTRCCRPSSPSSPRSGTPGSRRGSSPWPRGTSGRRRSWPARTRVPG